MLSRALLASAQLSMQIPQSTCQSRSGWPDLGPRGPPQQDAQPTRLPGTSWASSRDPEATLGTSPPCDDQGLFYLRGCQHDSPHSGLCAPSRWPGVNLG